MRPDFARSAPGAVLPRRVALLAPLLLVFPAQRARAHAVLVSSTPSANGRISVGKTMFVLRFNSRVDHSRSRLILLGPDGNQTVLTIDPATDLEVLTATAIVTEGGQSLRWQVLARDGHITRGDIPFKAARN